MSAFASAVSSTKSNKIDAAALQISKDLGCIWGRFEGVKTEVNKCSESVFVAMLKSAEFSYKSEKIFVRIDRFCLWWPINQESAQEVGVFSGEGEIPLWTVESVKSMEKR